MGEQIPVGFIEGLVNCGKVCCGYSDEVALQIFIMELSKMSKNE